MRHAAVIIAILTLTAPAHADIGFALHLGAGLEGGTVTRAVRPDGVAEAGFLFELLRGNAGVAVTIDVVERLTSRFEHADELKYDAMFRWATDNRKLRIGVGVGIRRAMPTDGIERVLGYDLARLDLSGQLAHLPQHGDEPQVTLDGYFSWTVGCYRDDYKLASVDDMAPVTHSIGCAESVTTAYVIGLRTSIGWR